MYLLILLLVDNVEDTFPIAGGRVQLRKKWIHCPGRQSVALLHNPPHNVTAERVEDFLEAKEIDADVARDDEGIKVVLHNATGKVLCMFIVVHYVNDVLHFPPIAPSYQ